MHAPLRELPVALRHALIGAVVLGVPGAAVGLALGLRTYVPTAWAATFEVGLPAALLGARRLVLVSLVGAAMLFALGVYVGLRSPWGAKHPQVAHGIAMRANHDNDLVMFDADDGTQIDFGAHRIWWESGAGVGRATLRVSLSHTRRCESRSVSSASVDRREAGGNRPSG